MDIPLPGHRASLTPNNRIGGQGLGLRSAPRAGAAYVNNKTITISYDNWLHTTRVPTTAAFVVKVNGSSVPISSLKVLADTLFLTLTNAVAGGDTVTCDYTNPNDWQTSLQSLPGQQVGSFTAYPLTNTTGQQNFWIFGLSKFGIDTRFGA